MGKVASSILTYKQAVALSTRQFEAAKHLLDGKYYGQAVARAYYSVYTLTHFVARRRPDWYWATYSDGTEKPSRAHEDTPGYVLASLQITTGHTLDPRRGQIDAHELMAQRVTADYMGYQEIPEETARRLLLNSSEIRNVLLNTAHQCQNDPLR